MIPRLAEKSEWSSDQKTLRVKLRAAMFSDGSLVTAKDVAESLSYCIRNGGKTLLVAVGSVVGYRSFVNGHAPELAGITVSGGSNIEIRLSRRSPLLLDDLAQADCHIVKPAANGSHDLLKGAIGSGPYVLKSVDLRDVILERNPHYYAKLDGPQTAVYRVTADYGRWDDLKSWVTMATTESEPVPGPGAAFQKIEISELGTYQLILNNSKAPFNRVEVRRAVGLALDYDRLAEKLGWSPGTLQAGLVPLGMTGFKHRETIGRAARVAQAIRLLKQAGYTARHPLKFTVLLSQLPDYEKEASLWPTLFAGAPIEVRVELVSHAERIARTDRGEFQAVRSMKYAGSSESHRLLSTYLSGSSFNPTRSREPECDRLISRSISTLDRDARYEGYAQADACLMDRAILVPLASIQSGYVFLKEPWKLSRTNRYLLYPYWISEWRQSAP